MTSERLLVELPWGPNAPRLARRALRHWGANPEAAVVVSELVTNALQHGAPPISLVTERRAETFRVGVHDERRDMGTPAPNSFGLSVIDMFSARWGISRVRNDGKCVWAEFPA